MKTKLAKQILFISFAILSTSFMLGCSSNSSGGGSGSANATSYISANGLCYTSGGSQVSSSYCSSTASTGYYSNGGVCYSSSGTQVSSSYCATTSYHLIGGICYTSANVQVSLSYCSGNASGSGPCYGLYYWGSQEGYCYGSNCSGYTLVSATTGQSVYCQ